MSHRWPTFKKGPLVGGVIFRGLDISYPGKNRDYFISHEIRIPSLTNQYFNGK